MLYIRLETDVPWQWRASLCQPFITRKEEIEGGKTYVLNAASPQLTSKLEKSDFDLILKQCEGIPSQEWPRVNWSNFYTLESEESRRRVESMLQGKNLQCQYVEWEDRVVTSRGWTLLPLSHLLEK